MNTKKLFKTDYECAVLAAYIFDPDSFHSHDSTIDLFTQDRAMVYAEVRKLILGGNEPDLTTIVTELDGTVPASNILLIVDTPLSTNLEFHLEELDKARIRREMSQAASRVIAACEAGGEPGEIEAEFKRSVSMSEKTEIVKLEDLSIDVMNDLEGEAEGRTSLGIRCGIDPIDDATGGFEGGELIIIAGRPGVGKTSLALNIARGLAQSGNPGCYFTLEMSAKQLTRRIMCDMGSIDSWLLFKGGLRALYNKGDGRYAYNTQFDKCKQVAADVCDLDIMIDPTAIIAAEMIYRRAKKAVHVHGAKWIAVDHLGLINGWTKDGQGPKNDITRMLKITAKDLNVPLFALSQMNREIDKRAEQVPRMSDLRDCGSIEADADIVMFPMPDIKPGEQSFTKRDEFKTAKIHFGKNRRGEVGPVDGMKWQGHYYRYSANHNIFTKE